MARWEAIRSSAQKRMTRSEATVRWTHARLASRAGRIRSRRDPPEHVPTGMERNIALLHRAGAELGIEAEDLPGGFVRLTLGDRERYGHGSDLDFEPLVAWFMCGDKELTS